jgi:hypothetical protein
MTVSDRPVRSTLLPGGDLVAAVLDRQVMTLADRGGASNLVGDRWADLVAAHVARWAGAACPLPGGGVLQVERVVRLDATPRVAALASKRGLQNPDLLLLGDLDGSPGVLAADAKFSVETARSKQVSAEVVAGLLGLQTLLPEVFAGIPADPTLAPGVFVCPDYPLTHLMLRRRHGIVRTTVSPDEVALAPVDPAAFFAPLEGAAAMGPLADIDDLPTSIDQSLLAALYYFRLARAGVGCWLDATRPLLALDDRPPVDEAAVAAEARVRAASAIGAGDGAFAAILRWNDDVQRVRNQRAAIEQVASPPLASRELRPQVDALASALGAEPPSLNKVRRRLGGWWRAELRDRLGPIPPPVADLTAELDRVAAAGRDLAPCLPARLERIVAELVAEQQVDGEESPPVGRDNEDRAVG